MKVHAKEIETNDEGWIVVTVDLSELDLEHEMPNDLHKEHQIYLRPEALVNRMMGYGLETPEEALDAILREHGLRLSTLQPQSEELIHQLGGTDDRISVEHSAQAEKDKAAILEDHADIIQEGRMGLPPDHPAALPSEVGGP